MKRGSDFEWNIVVKAVKIFAWIQGISIILSLDQAGDTLQVSAEKSSFSFTSGLVNDSSFSLSVMRTNGSQEVL